MHVAAYVVDILWSIATYVCVFQLLKLVNIPLLVDACCGYYAVIGNSMSAIRGNVQFTQMGSSSCM